MKSKFCFRIAISNIYHNKQTYFPYFIASISAIFTFIVFSSVGMSTKMESLPLQSNFVQTFFKVGKVIIALFCVFFLIYASSFLMKQRMKEIGLYSILGLEKKHTQLVLFFETIVVLVVSYISAIVLAIVFGNVFFLVFTRLMHISGENRFLISLAVYMQSLLLFMGIYFLILILNIIRIRRSNIITLLKSNDIGEKEPKNHKVMAILGFISLLFGYIYAFTATNFGDFILDIPIIIVATYIVFIFGSIFILKTMKKNESIYYKSKNFISISNLMYRMKKNGVSLASICICSTAVMLFISITSSVYFGKDNMLHTRFSFDITMKTQGNLDNVLNKIDDLKANSNISISEKYVYEDVNFTGYLLKDTLLTKQNVSAADLHELNYNIHLISIDDYNKLAGNKKSLNDNEILIFSPYNNYPFNNVVADNGKIKVVFNIKEKIDNLPIYKFVNNPERVLYIITNNLETMRDIFTDKNITKNLFLDVNGKEKDRLSFSNSLKELSSSSVDVFTSRDLEALNWYNYFGGGLFLCIFMGLLFLVALVIILYFKQLSEGYDDKKRLQILKSVGMSNEEVKATIKRQTLLMFFLPLIMATVHMLVAYCLVCKVLAAFYLTDRLLILKCTLVIILIFFLVYILVYHITSKVYYKIVNN